jgi:hypothetical protein
MEHFSFSLSKRPNKLERLFLVSFSSLGPMLHNFFVRDLQIFELSFSVCWTRLEKLTNDKHSSLLGNLVINRQKSFLPLGLGVIFAGKVRNLR